MGAKSECSFDVAVPVIHKEFSIWWRDILASRNGGLPIETRTAENAARQCAEEEDKLLLFKRRIFESGLKFEYSPSVTPDILFMFMLQHSGFVAKVHGDVACGHLPEFPLAEGDDKA